MNKMLYIIQNDPEVPPGNILDNLCVPYKISHPYRGDILPAIEDVSALIVLGGAMGANDDRRHPFLGELKKLIRAVVAAEIPYLGICLGGQLLAAAMGAAVVSSRWEELGVLEVSLVTAGKNDPLFSGISDAFQTFQWHHDSFDMPEGALLLASSSACPHQAFRLGRCAWGLQFHPEVTEEIIRSWCAWDTAFEKTEAVAAEFSRNMEHYRTTARYLLANFLQSSSLSPATPYEVELTTCPGSIYTHAN